MDQIQDYVIFTFFTLFSAVNSNRVIDEVTFLSPRSSPAGGGENVFRSSKIDEKISNYGSLGYTIRNTQSANL